jgi:hypothetical protein
MSARLSVSSAIVLPSAVTNSTSVEREQRNRSALGGHKLDLEGRAITVTVHHCPYVALFQTVFVNIMPKDDCI